MRYAWPLLLAAILTATAGESQAERVASWPGAQAAILTSESAPLIVLRFSFDGGAAEDPPALSGLTSILADLLSSGRGRDTTDDISIRLATRGARLSVWAGRDALHGLIECLPANFQAVADLIGRHLAHPDFREDEIARIRARKIQELQQSSQLPAAMAKLQWFKAAFGEQRYGRPIEGTAESISRVTRGDLSAHYLRVLSRSELKVVIVGKSTEEQVHSALSSLFDALPSGDARSRPRYQQLAIARGTVTTHLDQSEGQAVSVFGLPSISRVDPDFPALQILNHILGSGNLDSRLMDEVRLKRGLTYAISTRLHGDASAPLLLGHVASAREDVDDALQAIRSVVARLAEEGPTTTEFEDARAFVSTSRLMETDTSARLAEAILEVWRDTGVFSSEREWSERYRRVTLDDVRRVAKRVLRTDQLLISTARPR